MVILDGAGAHTSSSVVVPENVVLLRLPPYCPELNPVERLWRDLKARIAEVSEPWTDLDALREHVAALVRAYSDAQMHALTGYRYLVDAVNAPR